MTDRRFRIVRDEGPASLSSAHLDQAGRAANAWAQRGEEDGSLTISSAEQIAENALLREFAYPKQTNRHFYPDGSPATLFQHETNSSLSMRFTKLELTTLAQLGFIAHHEARIEMLESAKQFVRQAAVRSV